MSVGGSYDLKYFEEYYEKEVNFDFCIPIGEQLNNEKFRNGVVYFTFGLVMDFPAFFNIDISTDEEGKKIKSLLCNTSLYVQDFPVCFDGDYHNYQYFDDSYLFPRYIGTGEINNPDLHIPLILSDNIYTLNKNNGNDVRIKLTERFFSDAVSQIEEGGVGILEPLNYDDLNNDGLVYFVYAIPISEQGIPDFSKFDNIKLLYRIFSRGIDLEKENIILPETFLYFPEFHFKCNNEILDYKILDYSNEKGIKLFGKKLHYIEFINKSYPNDDVMRRHISKYGVDIYTGNYRKQLDSIKMEYSSPSSDIPNEPLIRFFENSFGTFCVSGSDEVFKIVAREGFHIESLTLNGEPVLIENDSIRIKDIILNNISDNYVIEYSVNENLSDSFDFNDNNIIINGKPVLYQGSELQLGIFKELLEYPNVIFRGSDLYIHLFNKDTSNFTSKEFKEQNFNNAFKIDSVEYSINDGETWIKDNLIFENDLVIIKNIQSNIKVRFNILFKYHLNTSSNEFGKVEPNGYDDDIFYIYDTGDGNFDFNNYYFDRMRIKFIPNENCILDKVFINDKETNLSELYTDENNIRFLEISRNGTFVLNKNYNIKGIFKEV